MKHVIITVGLFFVSSLASANLSHNPAGSPLTSTSQMHIQNIAFTTMNMQAFTKLVNLGQNNQPDNKLESIYSNLFQYSSLLNNAVDSEFSAPRNNVLPRSINQAVYLEQVLLLHQIEHNNQDILQFADSSLNNDNAVETDIPVNAVPLPAAIWLFSSAILLFGFARRSSI